MPSTDEIRGGIHLLKAIADTIKEAGSIPEGVLYSCLMGRMDLNTFNQVVALTVRSGLVVKQGHVLVWRGPR